VQQSHDLFNVSLLRAGLEKRNLWRFTLRAISPPWILLPAPPGAAEQAKPDLPVYRGWTAGGLSSPAVLAYFATRLTI